MEVHETSSEFPQNCSVCGFPERTPHYHGLNQNQPPTPTPFPTDHRCANLERIGHVYGRRVVVKKNNDCCVSKFAKNFFKRLFDCIWYVITAPLNCFRCKKHEKIND